MYTLEDDQETSSRLRKDDLSSVVQPGTFNQAPGDTPPTQSTASHVPHFSATQITNSFKKLTTPDTKSTGNKKVALAALTIACIGVFFTALDQTVVVTALPQMITDLQIPITQLDHAAWIISAYLLGFVIAMPLMGRVSDIYGRRRIFLLCLIIFGLGSVFCGLAPQLGQIADLAFLKAVGIDTSSPGLVWLIAARLFQAIGGGAIVPVSMAIAGDFYGPERRGMALGIIGAVTEAGGVLGPVYGAVVVEHLGWQYIFYLNVPLVIALMVGAWILIPKGKRRRQPIDWLGTVLLGAALTCLSLGLAQQGTSLSPNPSGSAPQNNPLALALAILFLAAFVIVELKVRWPVVEVRLFKRWPFTASALVSLLVGAALIIAMADIPIFVDTVLQRPVMDSSMALLRLTAMIPIGALLGGWLCSRITCRITCIIGLLFTSVGFFLMSRWPAQVDWNQITISTVTAGFGFGLVISPIGTTAINAVKTSQAGMSSAVVTALRMVGMMLGLAALTSWALAYFKQLARQYPTLPANATATQFSGWSKGYAVHLIHSAQTVYNSVFFLSMVLCLIAIIPAIFLWGKQVPVAEVEPEELLEPSFNEAVTLAITDIPTGPIPNPNNEQENPDNQPLVTRWWHNRKRRLAIICISIGMILLLVGGGIFAAYMLEPDDEADDSSNTTTITNTNTTTPGSVVSGPRNFQIGLDKTALTSLFVSQLGLSNGALSDMAVGLAPNNGLILTLNLHIDSNGIHRVMPIEMDGVIGLDQHQNLQLTLTHLKRDGQDADANATATMQSAMNQLLTGSVMTSLHNTLKGVKLISVRTTTDLPCSKGALMFVIQIEAPPIQGVAAQSKPVAFCLSGPIDPNNLMPH